MIFNQHSRYEGCHAFLSASKYNWLNYDEDHLKEVLAKSIAAARGTQLHELAAKLIELKQKLPRTNKTLNRYVNDGIGYHMTPEQVLYYSDNCFGTADTISFENKFLRIHDLKTGEIPAKMDQLKIYAAIFCLEYYVEPEDIEMELRIYQNDDIEVCKPESEEIRFIMNKIENFSKLIDDVKRKEAEA